MKKVVITLATALASMQLFADVVAPELKTGFFKALYSYEMLVINFVNYDPNKRPHEIEKMQDAFYRVSDQDVYEHAGIGFIGINLQKVGTVKKTVNKQFNIDLDVPVNGSVVMLFANGDFVKDDQGKPVKLEGVFVKSKFEKELTRLIDQYFSEAVESALEEIQKQPKVRYVPTETVRYVSTPTYYSYPRYYARPYVGFGFGRPWGWGGRRWGGWGGWGPGIGFGFGGGRGGIGFGFGW